MMGAPGCHAVVIDAAAGCEHRPRYFAVQVDDAGDDDLYLCEAMGAEVVTFAQLERWARRVAAEVVVIQWRDKRRQKA